MVGTLTTGWLADPTLSTGASLAQSWSGASSWLLSDPFANTVASVSTTGNTVSGTTTMDAFVVERVSATGSLADASVGFAGQYLDTATGLCDMRARDYDPTSGRFTATDPVDVSTGSPYFAGYSYAHNNPLMYSDASGLTACGPIGSDCNGANLVPVFQRLAAANNETAYINLYQSLTEEQANQIPFDELSLIASESMNFQLHQMACEASPGECRAPCPEQGHARCELERGAYFLAVYVAPLLLGVGAGALLERACATDVTASLAARTTAADRAVEIPPVIFREGTPRPGNLTPRELDDGVLSFRDSLSNPIDSSGRPVFRPGEPYFGIDTSRLPAGSVVVDNVPPGHVSVSGVAVEDLQAAVVERGRSPK